MTQVVWRQAALQHIPGIFDYLFAQNPAAAMKVTDHLRATGDGLKHFPKRGRPVSASKMRDVTTAFPYVIRCRLEGNEVMILRVRHAGRRPAAP